MKLSIARKGLILVAVPLIFELVFVAILTSSLRETEARIDNQLRAQALVEKTTILMRELVGTSFAICFRYLSEQAPADLSQSRNAVMDTYQTLDKQVGDEPDLKLLSGKIRASMDNFFVSLEKFSEMTPSDLLYGLTSGGATLEKIRADMRLIDRSVRKFRNKVIKGNEFDLPDETKANAAQLKLMLLQGVGSSLVLTILLALSFSQSISTRLTKLAENTRRVSRGQPPLPLLGGSDELSVLDMVIHRMSSQLQQAEYQRKQLTTLVHSKLSEPLAEARRILLTMESDDKDLTTKGKDASRKATQTLDRLVSLLNDLTQLEQIESGQIELHKTKLEAQELISKAIENVQALANKKRLQLEQTGEKTEFVGDGERLTQILVNLLSNAIKFSPEGARIETSAALHGGAIEFRVKDEGPGIPKEMQSKIFERYEQTAREDATAKGGAGLGLNICAVIASSHKGKLGVDSEPGKGSEFWLKLPQTESSSAEVINQTDKDSRTDKDEKRPDAAKESKGFRFKIWQKGLIVIAVPLLLQISFVAMLATVLEKAQKETLQELRAMAVVSAANELFRNAINLGASAGGGYVAAGSGVTIDQRVHSIEINNLLTQIARLYDLEKNDPEAKETVTDIFRASERVLFHTSKMMLDPPPGKTVGTLMIVRKRVSAIQRSLDVFAENLSIMLSKQQAIERKSPALRERTRWQIMTLIVTAVMASVLLSLVLGLFFSRGISRRVSTLIDNTLRFTDGKELLPPLKGQDELCEFDNDFRQMVKRIEESGEFKKHLLAVVSHELRTPLTSIYGTINLLCEGLYGKLGPESTANANKAYEDIAEVIQLINDLLEIERMEAGKFPMEITELDLSSVLNTAMESTKKSAGDTAFDLENLIEGPAVVAADLDLITKAISRLLVFSASKNTICYVKLKIENEDLVVQISDSSNWLRKGEDVGGYEKYELLQQSEGRSKNGMALTLALCKTIVMHHGGKLSSCWEDTKGGCFRIALPKIRKVTETEGK